MRASCRGLSLRRSRESFTFCHDLQEITFWNNTLQETREDDFKLPELSEDEKNRYKSFWGRFRSSSSQSLGEASVGEKDEVKSKLQSPSSLEALTQQFIGAHLEGATVSPTATQPLPFAPLTVPLVQPATVTQGGAEAVPAPVAPSLPVPASLTVPLANPVQPATVTQSAPEAETGSVAASLAPPTVSPGALPGAATAVQEPAHLFSRACLVQPHSLCRARRWLSRFHSRLLLHEVLLKHHQVP